MLLVKTTHQSMDNLVFFHNYLNLKSPLFFSQQRSGSVLLFPFKSSFCISYCTSQNSQGIPVNQTNNLVFFKSNLIKLLSKQKSTTKSSITNQVSIQTQGRNLNVMLASDVNPKLKAAVKTNKSHNTDKQSESFYVSTAKESSENPKQSYFFKYSRLNEYKQLGVQVASPEKIRHWSERLLPTGKIVGEVLNANTLHHKTLKPLKGGLFCERIFGPTKDFQCACGKTLTKRQRLENTTYSLGLINLLNTKTVKHFYCRTCDVEYTWALARRYQLGYIALAFPVTHLWYTKGFSNPISLLLDLHKYDLDSILYCSQTTSLEKNYELTEINITQQASNAILELNTLAKESKKRDFKQEVRKHQKQKNHYKITKITKLGPSLLSTLKQSERLIKNHKVTSLLENVKRNKIQNSLLNRKNQIQTKTGTSFQEQSQSSTLATSLILESILVSLITVCATVSYLPFISWLTHYVAKSKQDNFRKMDLINTSLPTRSLVTDTQNGGVLPQNFADFLERNSINTFTFDVSKGLRSSLQTLDESNTELNPVNQLTQNFLGLKQKFRKNIVVFREQSSYYERRFHKHILELRNELKTLPKQIITVLNKQLYRDLYFTTRHLLNGVFARLRGKQTELTLSNLSDSRKLDFYLQYLGLKLKGNASDVKYSTNSLFENEQSQDIKKALNSVMGKTNAISNINLLAIQFILVYLKKRNNNRYFVHELSQESYLSEQAANNYARLERKPLSTLGRNPATESTFFYYNLYQLADDHLWENITDWNLLKSYITVYPDVMDRPIPSYKHRIPLSGLGNFLAESIAQDYSLSTKKSIRSAQLSRLSQLSRSWTKKYSLSKQNMGSFSTTPFWETRGKCVDHFGFYGHRTEFSSVPIQNRNLSSVSKRSKQPQAVLGRSAGAGVINTLLTSISYPELSAMNKQLMFLLRESRKKLLSASIGSPSKRDIFARGSRTQSSYDRQNISSNITNPFVLGTAKHSVDFPSQQVTTSTERFNPSFSSSLTLAFNEIRIAQTKNGIDDVVMEYCDDTKSTILARDSFETVESVEIPVTKTALSPLKIDRFSGIEKQIEKHYELLRRAKIIKKFSNTKVLPRTLILRMLPVLPPELRPIMKMSDQIATSDINRLYQRVLYRNERLAKLSIQLTQSMNSNISLTTSALAASGTRASQQVNDSIETPVFGYEKHYAQRLLQEAVDNLIDNGRAGGNSEKDAKGRALKSLSEVLKGKQGRFRQYLLGKRVDYSGRSVIVVGPKLKIHQCGLPREMAIELYLPFIIQYLIQMNYTKTVIGAKTLISKNKQLIDSLLENVVRGHPVILNRAPTLHRLGFQAFQPILVDGRAILLHPMACTAFNADFDGDQMAVHIPITVEARSEAWRLMLARNNLLSPATGDPIILPSQDMVLGCYYLTTLRQTKSLNAESQKSTHYYSNIDQVLYLYNLGKLHIHAPVWVKCTHIVFTETLKKPLEIRINMYGSFQEIYKNTEFYYDSAGILQHQYIRTTPGRILFNLILKKI